MNGDKVWESKNLATSPKAGARAQNKSITGTSRQTSMDTQAGSQEKRPLGRTTVRDRIEQGAVPK